MAIVSCGGGGARDQQRGALHWCWNCTTSTGVKNIVGVKFGFQGFIPSYGYDLLDLSPKTVADLHRRGGSFLGMSRGGQDVQEVVDSLERLNIGLLFAIGGDGTLRAVDKITEEIAARNLKTSVVSISQDHRQTTFPMWTRRLVFPRRLETAGGAAGYHGRSQ